MRANVFLLVRRGKGKIGVVRSKIFDQLFSLQLKNFFPQLGGRCVYNPQNEMFGKIKTKCQFSKNEMYPKKTSSDYYYSTATGMASIFCISDNKRG